jgi:hypothetical protein
VTFGAIWRRSVIAIWRLYLATRVGSERVDSVLYPMAYEAARLQNTTLTKAGLAGFGYPPPSLFDFRRALIRATVFNVATMPHKIAMVHPKRAWSGSGAVAPR